MNAIVAFSMLALTCAAAAEEIPTKNGTTAQWMIAQEKAWANMACGGKSNAAEILADDFRGTAPKGSRYGKPTDEPAPDPKTKWSTDCTLDAADVTFYSADAAVVYGGESKTVELPDGTHERRCLVWTDMWLRRHGKWQIIAVQDNRIDCPAK